MTTPGPWRITFDTNPDDCNLRCIMCEDHSPYSQTQRTRITAGLHKRRMPIDWIETIIAQAKPRGLKEIIPSTMGEPLLYKHFETILALCHTYDIKLNLTTNGTFPIKGAKTWAKLLVPVTSDVKISWNGATKVTHEHIMRRSSWEKVIDNVTDFIAVRDAYAQEGKAACRVTFQLIFLEENVHELAEIVALAIHLGVDRVKGHHLWAHFTDIQDSDMRRNRESRLKWNAAVAQAHKIADTCFLPNGKRILLENIYPLPLSQEKEVLSDTFSLGECPFLGKEAWVAADGRFNPCCAPDKVRRTLGDFGYLPEKTLTDIWESEAYQRLKVTYPTFAVCKTCNMRKINTP